MKTHTLPRRLPVLIVIMAQVFCLSSCMVGPDFSPPDMADNLPGKWAAADLNETAFNRSREPESQWWQQFNDPVLSGLIQQLNGSSIPLSQARERVVEAAARNGVTAADKQLQLAAALGYTRASAQDKVVSLQGIQAGKTLDVYSAGLTAGWEADLWGRTARLLEAGEEDIRASYADFYGMFVSLCAELSLAYIEARILAARIDNVNETLDLQIRTRALARSDFEAGNGTALTVAQADRLIAGTRARLPELSSALAAAQNRIKVMLSRKDLVIPPGPLPQVPPLMGTGLPADLVSRRPDIALALHQYHSAVAGIGAVQAEQYPALAISGRLTLSTDTAAGLFGKDALVYSLGPGVSFPLFTGNRIESKIAVQQSRAQQARLALEQQIIQALAEVETAMVGVSKSRRKVEALIQAQKAAAHSVALADELYRAGLGNLFQVLDNEQQLVLIQESLLTARQQALSQTVSLYRALGGGWQGVITDTGWLDADSGLAVTNGKRH